MKITKLFGLLAATIGLGLASCNNTPAPVESKFPVKEVIAFFDEARLDVVVPSYESKTNDFEVDTEDPKAYVVYANGSSHDEMAAYKDALIKDSWVLANEVDGDYLLGYAETNARVSLVDFGDYVGIAFSVYEEVKYDAAKVTEDFNANLAAESLPVAAEWDEDYQEYGLAVSFGESTDEGEENLKNAAYTLGSFLPDYMILEFEIYGDPTSEDYYDLFGDGSIYYYVSLISPDQLCGVAVVSYVYNGLLIGQISIADLAE